MPNGHGYKEYGGHSFSGSGTSDCQHGCGCWMGPARSGGPAGIDPFGECPNNPVDGKRLGEGADRDKVVEQRIDTLMSRANRAETLLARVSPSKKKLAEMLAAARKELRKRDDLIAQLQKLIEASIASQE